MDTKKNKVTVFILIALVFTILYIIFAAQPLTKEYQFTPEWKISTSTPIVKENNDLPSMYFRLGQTLGYFNENGEITVFKTFPGKASISDSFYAIYNSDAKNTPFYNNMGKEVGKLEVAGFPFFSDREIFVFLPGGASFAKCYETGKTDWQYQGTIPITAFTTKERFSAAGFADGNIKLFNNASGKTEISFAPGGSDYSVIFGLDISSDGEYIASVSGHKKQRFVVSHKENGQQKIVFHTFLDEGSPYRRLVHFTSDNKRIFYNYQNNIGIYDFTKNSNTIIPIKSDIISIEETENLVFLLGKNDSEYTVYIVEKTNTLEGSFSFTADTAFIHTYENTLYIGKDNSISKISITKE